jgi:hypothetical protein
MEEKLGNSLNSEFFLGIQSELWSLLLLHVAVKVCCVHGRGGGGGGWSGSGWSRPSTALFGQLRELSLYSTN